MSAATMERAGKPTPAGHNQDWMQLMTCQPKTLEPNNPKQPEVENQNESRRLKGTTRRHQHGIPNPLRLLYANEIDCNFTSLTVVHENFTIHIFQKSIISRPPHMSQKKNASSNPFGRLILLSHWYPVHRTTPPDHQSPWGPGASAIVLGEKRLRQKKLTAQGTEFSVIKIQCLILTSCLFCWWAWLIFDCHETISIT